MTTRKSGMREDWLAARLKPLDAEKALTRESDELAQRRQLLERVGHVAREMGEAGLLPVGVA